MIPEKKDSHTLAGAKPEYWPFKLRNIAIPRSAATIFFLLLILLLCPGYPLAQVVPDSYRLESDGYLRHPRHTPHGIIATNNYASELYLIQEGNLTVLVSSPGSGRYASYSKDGRLVGFKSIDGHGRQAPAVLDLDDGGEVRLLHDYTEQCGQPSFFGQDEYAFTVGTVLRVYRRSTTRPGELEIEEHDLGDYVNLAPVSPDGHHVIYNNIDDELLLMEFSSGSVHRISPPGQASFAPVWSPDGGKIAYMTNRGRLFVYELASDSNHSLGKGRDPSWHDDSEQLVFTRSRIEDFKLMETGVVQSRYDGRDQRALTDPAESAAHDGSVAPDGGVLYYDLTERRVIGLEREEGHVQKKEKYSLPEPGRIRFRPSGAVGPDGTPLAPDTLRIHDAIEPDARKQGAQQNDPGFSNRILSPLQSREEKVRDLDASILITGVPFVNQVWDTPFFSGNSYNYASCAPTTAVMVIGYFEKLPPWPSHRHQGIRRDYANYVALEYSAYGHTYNTVSRGVMGGMGYMWSGQFGSSGSPRTTMRGYVDQHDLESVQYWDTPYSNLLTELEDGNPYPLCVLLTTSGHLILAVGVQEARRTVIVMDPYGNKNISYPSYDGIKVVYDWPGYNYGNQNLERVAWTVTARGDKGPDEDLFQEDRPEAYALHQNYPNPFNPSTTIRFDLPRSSHVNLEIFCVSGRRVAVLIDGEMPPDAHEVVFDASGLASGVYIYRLRTGQFERSIPMVLVR